MRPGSNGKSRATAQVSARFGLQPGKVLDDHLTARRQVDNALPLELGELAADRFNRQPQQISRLTGGAKSIIQALPFGEIIIF